MAQQANEPAPEAFPSGSDDVSQDDVARFLQEARATELAVLQLLAAQVTDTPPGPYRHDLQRHVREARRHVRLLQDRLEEIGHDNRRGSPTVGPLRSWVSQVREETQRTSPADEAHPGAERESDPDPVAESGSPRFERMLEHVRDQCATAGLEIATYAALERMARAAGDTRTERLAAGIRAEEEHMLQSLLGHVARLARSMPGHEASPESG